MRSQAATTDTSSRVSGQEGMALITTMMVMMLISALMVGFVAAVIADNRVSGLNHDQTQAYAAAHAGLEKLTSDLSGLFTSNFSPTAAQVNALTTTAPSVPGFSYLAPDDTSGYRITFTADASGNPTPADPNGTTISAGPYQGFKGIITPYDITVTARSTGGAEVRMRRTLQTVAVPVFQFGMFSENDLSFFAGPNFNFGGRVHTNANLYLAEGNNNTLTMSDRVTAVGEVIRTNLSNGWATSTNYTGTVNLMTSPNVFRALARTEGSVTGAIGSAQNEPTWTNLSVGTYNTNIRNGRTGARRLDLPLVSQGATAIDLIRRPGQSSNENTANPLVYQQRYFAQASLRILLSDTPQDITNLPTVTTATAPVRLGNLTLNPLGASYVPSTAAVPSAVAPFATSAGTAGTYTTPVDTPLLDGYIKIERQTQAGVWQDVTFEILNLGVTGRNLSNTTLNTPGNNCAEPQPNAIIRIQRVKDVPTAAGFTPCGVSGVNMSPLATDYWPNVLYDTREGLQRDSGAGTSIALGGVMQYVEFDVNNYRRWLTGAIAGTGNQSKNTNGFIVYFSDRRNNRNGANETGEYGFEDVVNPADANGVPNGVLDAGEDSNGNGLLDTYGQTPPPTDVPAGSVAPLTGAALPQTTAGITAVIARANKAILFRRALKLVNGGIVGGVSSLPQGFTVAAENPIYVQGDYNALANDTLANPHVPAAVIADAVTLLSNNWNDIRSLVSPNAPGSRGASTTGYRMAIVGGKPPAFPQPGGTPQDFGTDGGAHNFLRYLEGWGGSNLNYRGSIVSFFFSRQAVGTYKCCSTVYGPPTRGYNFDSDFLTPSLLPPGTPMFRDINTLTFRQLLRPTQ